MCIIFLRLKLIKNCDASFFVILNILRTIYQFKKLVAFEEVCIPLSWKISRKKLYRIFHDSKNFQKLNLILNFLGNFWGEWGGSKFVAIKWRVDKWWFENKWKQYVRSFFGEDFNTMHNTGFIQHTNAYYWFYHTPMRVTVFIHYLSRLL